jgi:hypothetical protein
MQHAVACDAGLLLQATRAGPSWLGFISYSTTEARLCLAYHCYAAFRLRRSRRAHDGDSSPPVSPQHAERSHSSASRGEGTTLDRAGSAGSSSSDADATEQRVQGSMIAAEDIEFCRHADGTPWLLGSGVSTVAALHSSAGWLPCFCLSAISRGHEHTWLSCCTFRHSQQACTALSCAGPHGQVYKALRGGVQEVAVKVLQRTSGKRLQRLIDVRRLGFNRMSEDTHVQACDLHGDLCMLVSGVQHARGDADHMEPALLRRWAS